MKIRPDGSTKVLEIIQQSENDGLDLVVAGKSKGILSNASNLILGKKGFASNNSSNAMLKKKFNSSSSGSATLLPLFRENNRLMLANNMRFGKHAIDRREASQITIDRNQALIEVFFRVAGVSLSIMDSVPQEICYFRLHDIEMNVVRYFDTVQFSVTVQELQLSNQSLNPTFPVAIFPRKLGNVNPPKKLCLPGFTSSTNKSPALHLYMQQKYIFKTSENPETVEEDEKSTKDSNKTDLRYFDVFSIWVAPLQLALDEELIVRLVRYIQALRLSFASDAGGNNRSKRLFSTDMFMNSTTTTGNVVNNAFAILSTGEVTPT